MLRTALRLLVALGVSGACLYYATRGTDWAGVARLLATARPEWVLGVVVVSLACHVIRTERWRILLRPVLDAPFGAAFSATLVGFGASMVLPLRLGEIVRPALLARRTGIGLTPAVASIVIERLLDVLLVVMCFVVVALLFPALAAYRAMAVGLGAAGAAALGVLYVMARHRKRADALVERIAGRLPLRLQRVVRPIASGVLDGARGLGDAGTLAGVLALSAILWALITGTYLLSFLAIDLPVPLVAASLATVVIVALFVFLPQGPGFVGTWQAACVVSLSLFGIEKDAAVGFSLLTWFIQMAVNIGAGAIAAAFQDLSVRQLVRQAEVEEPARSRGAG
ncbi:MAG TPA: lysylphosphatidylglycerol synthase transmembrane domain-containing protein [Candidatus Limnocylindria bacterium]|nr:lysylphosphatidylglycerol synthase transmembrane domain-containing protein [Candidatus Limnocylindria bacterium]